MADAARLTALRRAIKQQGSLRDRALATRADIAAQEAGLAARERLVWCALDADADGALRGLMLAGAARRLEHLARERAILQAQIAAAETQARHHERLARAGGKRLEGLAREVRAADERAALAELLDGQVSREGPTPASPA